MSSLKQIDDKAPNQDTIDLIQHLLDDAKRGDVRSVILVTGWYDDNWTHAWSLDKRNCRKRMLGEMYLASSDMQTNMQLDDDDSALQHALDYIY